MDIYAHDGQLERAEAVFAKTEKPNVFFYTVLIKAYGNCNQADRGAEVLQKLLQDSRVEPTVDVFNSLVEAWAKSSRPDAVEQAFSVLLIMDENAKCLKLGIRPDVVSFNTLLKCIASSKRSDSSKKAEAILDIMDRRYLAGDKLAKPDTISYNIAIKACFQSGDHERAEAVLRRMERSDTPPVVRTYSEILHHFVQVGTPAAAEKADRLLLSMKDLAKTSPSLKPNMFSYTIVLNAWARSGAANATDRMWKIYDQMMTDKIVLGMPCYNVLVSFLSRSRKVNDVTRADLLLQSMENSNRSETRPEGRHYALLLNGWIGVGDAESAARVFERWVAAGTRGVLEEGAKPTPDDFLLVTKVMIRSGDVLKASLFLEKMQKLCEAEKVSVGPDVRAYQALISAWSESSSSVKDTHMTHMQAKIDEFTRR